MSLACRLLRLAVVDQGVIATAAELFEARHFPNVVAICSGALNDEPDCVPLLMIRARAHMALRRDLDAQTDLRDIIRIEPACALAYRMLGELATRRDHANAAVAFFREALRLDPGDRETRDWLMIAEALVYPGRPAQPGQAAGPGRGEARSHRGTGGAPRFARGTEPTTPSLDDEWPTRPFASPAAAPGSSPGSSKDEAAEPDDRTSVYLGRRPGAFASPTDAPAARPAHVAGRAPAELPGFGEYLVTTGVLSRERLRAAEAYQRSMKVQLATAIVTLGLATPQRIEWAAVAHRSQLSGDA